MKLLMMRIGDGRYAVAADAVEQIVDPALETDFRLEDGEAVFHGERLALVDLHAAAGERPATSPVYLLVHGARRRAVVAVDGAESIRDVPPGDIAPLPAFIFSQPHRAFRGVFPDGAGLRLLLDQDTLL
jgi:chemotaxis signal transduction protein